MELLNPNKVLYDGVTVFNIYLHFTLKRKYLIITLKDRIVLFLLWSLLFKYYIYHGLCQEWIDTEPALNITY